MLLLRPKPPLAHYPAFIVCLATTLLKKYKYASQDPKNLIVILSMLGACAVTGDLRFTPPLCNYSHSPSIRDLYHLLLPISWERQQGMHVQNSRFMFREGEPSIKEFLASPAMCFKTIFRGSCCSYKIQQLQHISATWMPNF
jgi:hypothetical protein